MFSPDALLREARRQKGLAPLDVPAVCIFDPDGDILRQLRKSGRATRFDAWPCYHTELYTFRLGKQTVGIVGCVVGAPFAVLIAEELFACGCRFLLSLTSAGQINAAGPTPMKVLTQHGLKVVEMEGLIDEGLRAVFADKPIPAGMKRRFTSCGAGVTCKGTGTGCG